MAIRRRNYANGTCEIEFECGGKRHRQVVAATTDREARRLTKAAKLAKKAELAELKKVTRHTKGSAPLDLGGLFQKYFLSATKLDFRDCPTTAPNDQRQLRDALLNMLVHFDGMSPPIRTILEVTDDAVDELVRWRSAHYRYEPQIRARANKAGRKATYKELQRFGLVSPAHVHTTTTKALQAVFTYARKVLKLELPGEPNWAERRPKIPKKERRVLGDAEQVTLEDEMPKGFDKLFAFSIASCLRKTESLLLWSSYKADRRVVVRRIKGGDVTEHPLTAKACAIIESCRGDHPTHVFTYVCRRGNSSRGLVLGRRYPITVSNLSSAFHEARKRAGITGYKWHDNRRTGATEIYYAPDGGLKASKSALNHKSEATTLIYLVEDKRRTLQAMEAADAARDGRLAATRKMMAEQAPLLLEAPQRKRAG